MATERDRIRGWAGACGALGALVLLWGCSSGGGGGGGGANTSKMSVKANLPAAAQAVSVTGGANQVVSQVYALPATLGADLAVEDVTVDLKTTLGLGTVALKASPKAGGPAGALGAVGSSVAQMFVHVGPAADAATVCATGFQYGPFAVTTAAGGGVDVDPPTATASRQTMSVINTGSAAICVEIDADVDVDASLDKVALDLTTCDTAADFIGGDWSGTYHCANSGGASCGDEGGDVFLVIFQDEGSHSARYTSDIESFSGTVCGSRFRFDGGVAGSYTESGTFTRTGTGTATKHSEWHSVIDSCGGVCDDQLTQVASF
jgi:hypothetical protein